MSNLCPICSGELEAAITFGAIAFEVCFDCSYMTNPKKFCDRCESHNCLRPYDHRD